MFEMFDLKRYIPCIILSVTIFLLFLVLSYDILNLKSNTFAITSGGKSVKLEYEIKEKDNRIYLNISDYNKVLNNSIYFDKISRKIIFTTDKIGMYKERVNSNNSNIIYSDSNIWYSLDKIDEIYQKESFVINKLSKIVLLDIKLYTGKVLKNNTDFYYNKNKGDLYNFKLTCGNIVNVVNIDNNWITVTLNQNGKKYLGYVLKKSIKYNKAYKNENNNEVKNNYTVMLVSENKDMGSIDKINSVSIDLMRVVSAEGKVIVDNRDKVLKQASKSKLKIYASINNEYLASNYDNNLISMLLGSDESREKLINNISSTILANKLTGVILDFKNLKTSDKDVYTQFVKEITSVMHKRGLQVGVRSNLSSYIDTENVMKAADFVILELYNQRTTSSNVSGTHSLYSFVKRIIDEYCKKGLQSKIILEVPMYSILWTERGNVVVDAEIYTSKLADKYITKNKLKKRLSSELNQKYVEFTKGSIRYIMWLEDEFTLKNKINIVKQNNLKGISLYKSGYESNGIKGVLNEEI